MSKQLPLVQLSLLQPFLTGLTDIGIDPSPVLEQVGLTAEAVEDGNTSVHVMVVHQFVETCAEAAQDMTFCAKVGARLDPTGWPMIRKALDEAGTLGDFLNIYILGSASVASSAVAFLDIQAGQANFGERRVFKPLIKPAQNDGFMTALMMTMLERALGERLDPIHVLLTVSEPSALPAGFKAFQKLKGDWMGPRIRFPAEWLTFPISDKTASENANRPPRALPAASDFLSGFRDLLRQNIGTGELQAKQAADLVHMSVRTLSRRLNAYGTNISTEISKARIDYAKAALQQTDRSIEDIAWSLGYADPSNFTRAFRRSVGTNPTRFRANEKA